MTLPAVRFSTRIRRAAFWVLLILAVAALMWGALVLFVAYVTLD